MAGRGSATRRARRLGVQSDADDLCFNWRSVRNREAAPALKFIGMGGAMVGVSVHLRPSEFEKVASIQLCSLPRKFRPANHQIDIAGSGRDSNRVGRGLW